MGRRLILLLTASLTLAACAPRNPESWMAFEKNACLPEAIAMAQGLRQSGIHARVVRVETPKWGHAICTYLYPSGTNVLWGWDSNWKSNRLRAWSDNPTSIANEWLRVTMSDQPLTSAQFLD